MAVKRSSPLEDVRFYGPDSIGQTGHAAVISTWREELELLVPDVPASELPDLMVELERALALCHLRLTLPTSNGGRRIARGRNRPGEKEMRP